MESSLIKVPTVIAVKAAFRSFSKKVSKIFFNGEKMKNKSEIFQRMDPDRSGRFQCDIASVASKRIFLAMMIVLVCHKHQFSIKRKFLLTRNFQKKIFFAVSELFRSEKVQRRELWFNLFD